MAQLNFIHYLFAIFVVLAMVANARPASPDLETDAIAGMPGMSKRPGVAMSGEDKMENSSQADTEEKYMEDMKAAIEAAAKPASKATPTTAGPRPTPGVATAAPTTTAAVPSKPSGNSQASPSATKPAASSAATKSTMLSNIPLIGDMLGGLA